MKKKNSNKLFLAITIPVLVLSMTAYSLADRYLIEHVESTANKTSTASSVTTTISDAIVKADDWSYTSDTKTINIKKVETGSGSNKITYFVADVTLKDTSSLCSAFAKNKFGTNIIQYTSEIADNNDAIFAINGDYYGFRDDGIIIRNGELYRDVPTRDGVAFYSDGQMKTYDETAVSSSELLKSGVTNTFSFGPILVKDGKAITDFTNVKIDKNIGNGSIQSANPRTGIGMISANHFVFVVVDGRKANYSKGMTLSEFSTLFESLGCTEAYNLDGGGSSTMYFRGKVINNPLGKGNERGVSDILYIK